MEFDHAVVLDASGMNRKEFYVAATRASQSLTVLSSQPVLRFVTD
jgi:DNA helicase-2/ATP-dependent DNA helicase PcrA